MTLKNRTANPFRHVGCGWLGQAALRCLVPFALLLVVGCSKDRATYQPVELAPNNVKAGYRVEFVPKSDKAIAALKFHKSFIGTLCRAPRQEATEGLTNTWVFEFKAQGQDTGGPTARSGYAVLLRTGLFRVAEWHIHGSALTAKGLKTAAKDVMHRYGCKNDWTP